MRDWLLGLSVAAALMVASWGVLLLLARRLPPGLLRDLAAFVPDCVTTMRRLRRDRRVPRRAKIAIVIAGLWVARPIDLIPTPNLREWAAWLGDRANRRTGKRPSPKAQKNVLDLFRAFVRRLADDGVIARAPKFPWIHVPEVEIHERTQAPSEGAARA